MPTTTHVDCTYTCTACNATVAVTDQPHHVDTEHAMIFDPQNPETWSDDALPDGAAWEEVGEGELHLLHNGVDLSDAWNALPLHVRYPTCPADIAADIAADPYTQHTDYCPAGMGRGACVCDPDAPSIIPAELLDRVLAQHVSDHPGADHRTLYVETGYGPTAGLDASDWIVTLSYTLLATRDLHFPEPCPSDDATESVWDAWYDLAVWVETPDYRADCRAVYGVFGDKITLWMD